MEKQYKKVSLSGVVMFLWAINLIAQGSDAFWTRVYGGGDTDVGYSVQQTSDGGYIVVGCTYSFGAGLCDVYLIKTDTNGDTLWTRTYGGDSADYGYSVQETSGGGYILAGGTESFGVGGDVYLIKTDANGDTFWTRTYGGDSADYGYSVQETSGGGYIIAGYTESFGVGGDVYLIKTDISGDAFWTKTYGGEDSDVGYSVQETSDRGYILAGYTYSFGADRCDVYLVKTDISGDTLWTRTYGGTDEDWGWSVQETSNNGYIVAGGTYSFDTDRSDVYLIKTDASGNDFWTKIYGGEENDAGYSVQETSDGGYIIAGYTESFGVGGDVYLIKTNISGDTLWTRTYGGDSADYGYSVQETSDGEYIIAGCTESFGAGWEDVYLIKTGMLGIAEKKPFQKVSFISGVKPNPFKDRTLITYELPKNSDVHIVIYNFLGQEVRTLVNEKENAGMHTVTWDGKDSASRKVSSGIYFLKFKIREYNATRKLLMMK